MPGRPFNIRGVSFFLSSASGRSPPAFSRQIRFTAAFLAILTFFESKFKASAAVCVRRSNRSFEHVSSVLVSHHPASGTFGDVGMDDRSCKLSPSLIIMIGSKPMPVHASHGAVNLALSLLMINDELFPSTVSI
jgi:hypothetical protein